MDTIKILTDYAVDFEYEKLPEKTIKHIKALLTDTIGCIISGSREDGIKGIINLVDFWGGKQQSSIFSFDKKTSAPYAAFLNSVMGHANDFDDTHDPAFECVNSTLGVA